MEEDEFKKSVASIESAETRTATSMGYDKEYRSAFKESSEPTDYEKMNTNHLFNWQKKIRDEQGKAQIFLFRFAVFAILILAMVLLYHMVTPWETREGFPHYRLPESKVEAIKQFFLGGGTGAIFAIKYFGRFDK